MSCTIFFVTPVLRVWKGTNKRQPLGGVKWRSQRLAGRVHRDLREVSVRYQHLCDITKGRLFIFIFLSNMEAAQDIFFYFKGNYWVAGDILIENTSKPTFAEYPYYSLNNIKWRANGKPSPNKRTLIHHQLREPALPVGGFCGIPAASTSADNRTLLHILIRIIVIQFCPRKKRKGKMIRGAINLGVGPLEWRRERLGWRLPYRRLTPSSLPPSLPPCLPPSPASWRRWHATSSMIMSSAQILLYKPAVMSQAECPD